MNLLKANWEGKVGQTVGAKWKDKSTIRVLTKPSNPQTQAQTAHRNYFSNLSKTLASVGAQMKQWSMIDTSKMSWRNQIMHINADLVAEMNEDLQQFIFSKGRLPLLAGLTSSTALPATSIAVTWTPPTVGTITQTTRAVIFVMPDYFEGAQGNGAIANFVPATGSGTITLPAPLDTGVYLVGYLYDPYPTRKAAGPSNVAYILA